MPGETGKGAAAAYGVSAGLDLLSGVFSYLSSKDSASVARSRADLIRMESEANSQRYLEQAQQFEAHQKMMFLASGVKLSGSPIDVLANTMRVAKENMSAIRAAGERDALKQENAGTEAEIKGRNDLIAGGINTVTMGVKAVSEMGFF